MYKLLQNFKKDKEISQKIKARWLYLQKIDHQKKNCHNFNESNIWTQWADLIPIEDNDEDFRKSVLFNIGIEMKHFDKWYIHRRNTDALSNDLYFFDVIFEFLFDSHIMYRNVINEKIYLLKIGLHEEAIKEYMKYHKFDIFSGKNKRLFKCISFFYKNMIDFKSNVHENG